jgi:UDP-3-O-[3-hydroxymyristoyl] glucosamine N-acyltransferase
LAELASLTGGIITSGDPARIVTGFSSIQEAEEGDITFLGNSRYAPALKKSRASVVLTDENTTDLPPEMDVIRVPNPTLKFSLIIQEFGPTKVLFKPGIHPTACVAPGVELDSSTMYLGPHVVIEEGAVLGKGCALHAGVYIGAGAVLGEDCTVHVNAVIKERCVLGNRVIIHSGAVIGSDGFGYETSGGRHLKIDQVGIVQIDDDVEIGSCTTIDRARFGRTWIGEGSKIDNLVQIAHNVVTGKHCIIVSQVGISGSTRLGNYVTFAGQVGVAGHLNITDQVTVLAKSGLTKDLTAPGAYTGYPAKPLLEGRRLIAAPAKIPEMLERLRALEKKLHELESRLEAEAVVKSEL